jgi:hypothetical protein
MFILIPTCEKYSSILKITLALLDRYWAGHPPVHVIHTTSNPTNPWLAGLTEFLRGRTEELFMLLLDDYAICRSVNADVISRAIRLMTHNPRVGLFPLSWFPAARRSTREDEPGIVTLGGTPILLQAAIWQRAWFLELAEGMDPTASAWSFEAMATQAAKLRPREICAIDMPEPRYVGGHLIDAFDKSDWPIAYHNLMHRGQPELMHEPFLRKEGFRFPSTGVGDTFARFADATGATALAHQIEATTGKSCGCAGRRRLLNRLLPYDR